MAHSMAEIGRALGLDVVGNADLLIDSVAEPGTADKNAIAVATNAKYAGDLKAGQARAALLWAEADWQELGLEAAILPTRPRVAMAGLTSMMDVGQGGFGSATHPTAVIHPEAQLGENVTIGPLCVIGAGARIGAGSQLGPLCTIGAGCHIGPNAVLREQVSIGAGVRIGARFRAQPGARVGGDGFSYVTPEVSSVEEVAQTMGTAEVTDAQSWLRIHSLGAVKIGDDVEIGANATVDSGTIRPTEIGDGTKIDNLVMIGHNVVVGKDCLLCGLVGIAGSTKIGNNVVMAGQSGAVDNISIGDRAIIGAGSKVLSNVPAGRMMLGYPAMKMDAHVDLYKNQRRLGRLVSDVAAIKDTVSKLSDNG